MCITAFTIPNHTWVTFENPAAAQGKPAALPSTVKPAAQRPRPSGVAETGQGVPTSTHIDGCAGEGTRDAVEAWGDGAAAFSDWESPCCLAHRLCRTCFAGFDSGRAFLAGGVMGMR